MGENRAEEIKVEISTDLLAKMIAYLSYENVNYENSAEMFIGEIQRIIDERAIKHLLKLEPEIRERIRDVLARIWKNPNHNEHDDVTKISTLGYYMGYLMGEFEIADKINANIESAYDKMIQNARETLETQREEFNEIAIGIFNELINETDKTLEDKFLLIASQAFVKGFRDCYIGAEAPEDDDLGEYEEEPEIDI